MKESHKPAIQGFDSDFVSVVPDSYLENRILAVCPNAGIGTLRSVRLLLRIYQPLRFRELRVRLISRRPEIRSFLSKLPVPPLRAILKGGFRDDLTQLAIRLAGRCDRGSFRQLDAGYICSPNRLLRKEAVRALRRLHDWGTLSKVAASDADPRIRNMAAAGAARPFTTRMSWFLRGKSPVKPVNARNEVVLTKDYQPGSGLCAKPVLLIRQLLERIRQLVQGRADRN